MTSTRRARRLATSLALAMPVILGCMGHKSVHAELVIPAPPARIWDVLTDTAAYGEWNPIFVSVDGTFEEGATVAYQMKGSDGETSEVESEVRAFVPEREINQFGGIPFVVTFDHTWRIDPVPEGAKVTQHEEYRGVYVWFWDPSWVEDAYEEALVALRDRVTAAEVDAK